MVRKESVGSIGEFNEFVIVPEILLLFLYQNFIYFLYSLGMCTTAVIYYGEIFVIGGQHGAKQNMRVYNSVEKYTHSSHRWTVSSPMNRPQSRPQAGVTNNSIYVCGEISHSAHSSIERYDETNDGWTMVNIHFQISFFRKPFTNGFHFC